MPAANHQSRVHAILGTDEGRVKEVALALAEKLAPPDNEFGLEIISGQADNSDHAARIIADTLQAIQTLPFFGGNKVVWLQGANFLGDSVTGRAQFTLSAVEGLQAVLESGLPPDVTFILSASEIDKRRAFYKRLSKLAKVEMHDKVDISRDGWERQLIGPVGRWAREMGFDFEPGALERFILRVGVDTRQLRGELEKLDLFLGERRRATIDDVGAIAAATHTGAIFEIGNALGRRNLSLTLELIERQLKHDEKGAIGLLLAAIVPKIRNLLYARDLIEQHGLSDRGGYPGFQSAVGRLPAAASAHLPRTKKGEPNVYPIFLAARECRNFTAAELRDALESCLEANLRLVTTQLEPRLVLSQLVTRILSRGGPASRNRAA